MITVVDTEGARSQVVECLPMRVLRPLVSFITRWDARFVHSRKSG